MLTGSVAITYLSLPFVKEAAKQIKEATSLNNLAEIGHELGIPGIDAPANTRGVVNNAIPGYVRKLDDEMKNFMADIGNDQATEVVELNQIKSSARVNEKSRLLDD